MSVAAREARMGTPCRKTGTKPGRKRSGRSGTVSLRPNDGARPGNSGLSTWRAEDRLTPNPILRVLSTLRTHRVKFLLMGGQACVLYGGAEFSRDTDIAILADEGNLARLREALNALQAEPLAVPVLSLAALRRGHAVHFRCRHPEAQGIRIDIMSVMRGADAFPELWTRRTTVETEEGRRIDLLSLPDLVAVKKTRRDKDWIMLRRLVEAHYAQHRDRPTAAQVEFWLREARTPELLIEVARAHPETARKVAEERPAARMALEGHAPEVLDVLRGEEAAERAEDDAYWQPLMRELETLRRARRRGRADP